MTRYVLMVILSLMNHSAIWAQEFGNYSEDPSATSAPFSEQYSGIEDCFNKADDNNDGLVDCDDLGCIQEIICRGEEAQSASSAAPFTQIPDEVSSESSENTDPTVTIILPRNTTQTAPTKCIPVTCFSQKKNCGIILNGCGGRIFCGVCQVGEICGKWVSNVCAPK